MSKNRLNDFEFNQFVGAKLLSEAIPAINLKQATALVKNSRGMDKAVRNFLPVFQASLKTQVKTREEFYQKEFGQKCDFSQVKLPIFVPGFNRVLIIAKNHSVKTIIRRMNKVGIFNRAWPSEKDVPLDEDHYFAVNYNVRVPKKDYAVLIEEEICHDKPVISTKKAWDTGTDNQYSTLLETMQFVYEKHYESVLSDSVFHFHVRAIGSRTSQGKAPCVSGEFGSSLLSPIYFDDVGLGDVDDFDFIRVKTTSTSRAKTDTWKCYFPEEFPKKKED